MWKKIKEQGTTRNWYGKGMSKENSTETTNKFIEKFTKRSSVIKQDSILLGIEDKLPPESPKEFYIQKINVQVASELNKNWHSRLPVIHWSNIVRNTHHICFGAYHGKRWYAVGIWSSPVAQNRLKNGKSILELRRLAICSECPKNTASYMIAYMIKQIKLEFKDIKKLISYQDVDVHLGTIYKASNWKIGSECKGMKWNTDNRKRNAEQSLSAKIRWEYFLN